MASGLDLTGDQNSKKSKLKCRGGTSTIKQNNVLMIFVKYLVFYFIFYSNI